MTDPRAIDSHGRSASTVPTLPRGTSSLRFEAISAVVLAERMNIPVSYLANTDIALDPGVLQGARAYVSVGHDEYWSRAMRDAVVAARDAGTNLAFLGANTMYWRIRLESNARSIPGRVVVAYKWDARQNDPLYASNPTLATTRWRDAPSPEPENALTGMQYECFPVDTAYRVVSPRWWGFRKTGVVKGTSFEYLVGVEADRVYPVDSTPRPLQILSYSNYSCRGVGTSSQSTLLHHPVWRRGLQHRNAAVGLRHLQAVRLSAADPGDQQVRAPGDPQRAPGVCARSGRADASRSRQHRRLSASSGQ